MSVKPVGELAEELRAYAVQNRCRTLINTLTGGIDSSLSGAISKTAECEQVKAVAIHLPCSHAQECRCGGADAQRAADLLGLPMVTVDLSGVWQQMVQLLRPALEQMAADGGLPLTDGQIDRAMSHLQPALRSVVAAVFAEAFDGLTIGAGNAVATFLGCASASKGAADHQPIRHLLKGEAAAALAELGLPSPLVNQTPSRGPDSELDGLGFRHADAEAFVDWILKEEAAYALAKGEIANILMDETMTVRPNWVMVPTFTPCPVPAEVADRIVVHNQRTGFKRSVTNLRDTLVARGLI